MPDGSGAWLLVDHDSGLVLTEHGADQPASGAGLAYRLMTSYLVFWRPRTRENSNWMTT